MEVLHITLRDIGLSCRDD